jgi:hypothetical protein
MRGAGTGAAKTALSPSGVGINPDGQSLSPGSGDSRLNTRRLGPGGGREKVVRASGLVLEDEIRRAALCFFWWPLQKFEMYRNTPAVSLS